MDPSLRLVPASAPKSTSIAQTANSLGLHDTLQYGPRTIATEIKSTDGFRNRLENWEEAQDNLKLTMMRNAYGLHAPMRMLMERKMVSMDPHMPALPQSNIHLDILMGRDETIGPSDVFGEPIRATPFDIHADMEKKRRL
ncbi:proteasome maturation factor UMP1 [Marasmius fiardii PR-910]|nr:proteasome maturation factor UMP1 [Marasmius fiardii PR-910]